MTKKNNLNVNKEILREKLAACGVKDPAFSSSINEIYLMFSLNCNLHCNFCSFWGVTGSCYNKEFLRKMNAKMSRKDIDRIAEGIASLKVRTVTFSGGEPLLFKDWYYAAKKFKAAGATISLTTNGVFIEKYIKEIKDVVDEVNLSIQAPPEAIHFVRRDPPEHIKNIIRGLKKINELKKKNNNRPRLKILCTVSDMNYKYLDKLILFMKKTGITVDQYGFQHMMFIDKKTRSKMLSLYKKEFGVSNMPLWDGFTYPFPKNVDFKDYSAELKKVSRHKNVTFSPAIPEKDLENYYMHQKKPVNYENYCAAPWFQLNMLPNGDCYVCNDIIIGNVKKRSLFEIWNGTSARRLRAYTGKNLFPACWRCFYYYCDRKK